VIDALRRADVPLADVGMLLRDPSSEKLDEWVRQVEVDKAERHEALRHARELLEVDVGAMCAGAMVKPRKELSMDLMATTRTDIGRVRTTNEDRAVSLDRLVAVADGMGGLPGGETASSLTVAIIEAAFTGRSLDELETAVRAANTAVFERATADARLEGMGTTLCAVGLTSDGELAVVNVGDSRAYLLRSGSLQHLTTDHTLATELARQGELNEEDVINHPQRGVLTRAVGVGPTVDVGAAIHLALPGDRLLLCSDGLSNEVTEDQMLALITSEEDRDAAADALVDHALTNGGHDNIAVVVADVTA
jgi:protein phosphatase